MGKPSRWSYSSVSTYKQCPQKWKFSYIDGIEWPSSPAMTRGTRMHQMAEDFVTGKIERVPHEINKIGQLLLVLQSQKAQAEAVWMLDYDWKPTQDSGKAWVKAIVDVHYVLNNVLFVKDYKSGQMYDDHRNQLELYGLIGLCFYPEVKRVESSAVYMDTGYEGMEGSLIPAMKPKLIERWQKDAETMMSDEVYEPIPGTACRWCPYAQAKGGPCQY